MTIRKYRSTAAPRARRRVGAVRGRCPPHGPLAVAASEEGHYSASCLVCGARGPEREDAWEARLAFDGAPQPPPGWGRAG